MDELLKHIKEGNRQSFNDFYMQYHSKLYQYIYKYTHSSWLAEETVQMSFLKIWETRHTLSLEYTLSTQLFRVAKSIVIDLLRKSEVRKTIPLTSVEYETTSFEQRSLESKDELALVMNAIETMPPIQKRYLNTAGSKIYLIKKLVQNFPYQPKRWKRTLQKLSGTSENPFPFFSDRPSIIYRTIPILKKFIF